MNEEDILVYKDIHVPRTCEKCGKANPDYKGVGEYRCSECGFIMYDDFGKVRNYLEVHRGATQSMVAQATGVPMETIRQFLREERLEISNNSSVMLACEICNAPIRSGRYCPECAAKVNRMKNEASHSSNQRNDVRGFGSLHTGDSGAIRFRKNK